MNTSLPLGPEPEFDDAALSVEAELAEARAAAEREGRIGEYREQLRREALQDARKLGVDAAKAERDLEDYLANRHSELAALEGLVFSQRLSRRTDLNDDLAARVTTAVAATESTSAATAP